MTALILDGKQAAADLRADLAGRVRSAHERGIRPARTILVVTTGQSCLRSGKHRDCAQVGTASIRRDLPADASQADVERAVDEAQCHPASLDTSCSCRTQGPRGERRTGADGTGKDADACIR